MKIRSVTAREIFDSRGESTVEVRVMDAGGRSSVGRVPSGKSRGKREAAVLPVSQIPRALALVKRIASGKTFSSIGSFDAALIKADGTATKAKLGGNLMLGASIAFARGLALENRKEIWEVLRKEFFPRLSGGKKPLIFSNLINGGAHANNNLSIQEYMVVVRPRGGVITGVRELISFMRYLGDALRPKSKVPLPIGDEGGYSLSFKNNFEPIALMGALIRRRRLGKNFRLALDAAGTNFFQKGIYRFDGKRLRADKLLNIYADYFQREPLLMSIEDPFAESDRISFARLRKKIPSRWVMGDDLTTTNPASIGRCAEAKAINSVIIKPNQIGTVSETCQAVAVAQARRLKTVISHRSGEVEDAFIIHLARAANADGVKIGAPSRERIEKFNEIIRIY